MPGEPACGVLVSVPPSDSDSEVEEGERTEGADGNRRCPFRLLFDETGGDC